MCIILPGVDAVFLKQTKTTFVSFSNSTPARVAQSRSLKFKMAEQREQRTVQLQYCIFGNNSWDFFKFTFLGKQHSTAKYFQIIALTEYDPVGIHSNFRQHHLQ